MSVIADVEQLRQLGRDVSGVLDRYGVAGPNRIAVLLQVTWGEACLLKIGAVSLAGQAMQVWRDRASPTGFYNRK